MNPFEAFDRKDEKPLDFLVTDGGFSRIFRTICCVGDSLSSGEFETVNENGETQFHDIYEQSWGQYLARMNGAKVYNFSRGGMTAREYCESFAEGNDFWNPAYASQAYILALGVNDLINWGHPVGSLEDIDWGNWKNNKQTFVGDYARIVQRLKELQPEAKLFFMTMPGSDTDTEEQKKMRQLHASLLYQMSERFSNAYVLDFNQYAPVYDQRFRDLYYLRGHMNPCGYVLTAQMVASYLDYIIRHNMPDFFMTGLV